MQKLMALSIVLLVSAQAHAFIREKTKYECRDGRRIHINSALGNGTFGMDLYYEKDTNEYYEGSVVLISLSEANVFHNEGDKVGALREAGLNRIILDVDRKRTTCMLRKP